MVVVPDSDRLTAELRIMPQDIDQLRSSKARLRFTAFDRHTTPEIAGKVNRVSADKTIDQHTGRDYFAVRVTLSADEVAGWATSRSRPACRLKRSS